MTLKNTFRTEASRAQFRGKAPVRQPILFLGSDAGNFAFAEIAKRITQERGHAVTTDVATYGLGTDTLSSQNSEQALRQWRAMASEFHSACLGLIAAPGPSVVAAAQILKQSWAAGVLPGAIALLGFNTEFAATCLKLAGRSLTARQSGKKAGNVHRLLPELPVEWPPIMIFLPADDPSLAECASACRQMRAAGIPVDLEVMGSLQQGRDSASLEMTISELADELHCFFTEHLAPYFPKLL